MKPASRSSQTEMLLMVLFSLLGISLLVPSVSAIKCHQCNSHIDSDCEDVTNSTVFLKECEEKPEVSSEPYCRKTVQKVLADGDTRTIRSCGWEKSRQQCYRNDDDDHNSIVCQCFEEGCNSAPGRLAVLLSLTLIPVMLARLVA